MQLRLGTSITLAALVGAAIGSQQARGGDAATSNPKPIPQTRVEMKRALEGLKQRQPRLPLPPKGEDETNVNNGRARQLFLPAEWTGGSFPRPAPGSGPLRMPSDPAMTLDNTFKTRLFWIVSRTNNCYYCLGHQELKLHNDGMADDEIAALDCDWSRFPADERPAMEFARLSTLTPHRLPAELIGTLRAQYDDLQWIELVMTVAGYNSTNRWTDSTGIPQDKKFFDRSAEIDTPTSDEWAHRVTTMFANVTLERPPLEGVAEVRAKLAECRQREPNCRLLDEAAAREVVPAEMWSGAPLPQWVRAMAHFQTAGLRHIKSVRAVQTSGQISPKLKAALAMVSARHNRAWYAVRDAQRRLVGLGMDADAALAIGESTPELSAGERAALAFGRKLTVDSRHITDDDVAAVRAHFSPHETAEVIYVTCLANMFDRFTETLSLPAED